MTRAADKRARDEARRKERAERDRAGYLARVAEKERRRVRSIEDARTLLAERELLREETARLKAERRQKWAEEDARWAAEHRERRAREAVAAQDLADARKAESEHGETRCYCRLDVSEGVRCWLLPGHLGACQPRPAPPRKVGRGGAALWLLLAGAIGAGR